LVGENLVRGKGVPYTNYNPLFQTARPFTRAPGYGLGKKR